MAEIIKKVAFDSTADKKENPIGKQGPVESYGVGKAEDETQLIDTKKKIEEAASIKIRSKVKAEMENVVKNKPGWARYQAFTPD